VKACFSTAWYGSVQLCRCNSHILWLKQ